VPRTLSESKDMTMMPLGVYVFSYNRGEYVKNAINSAIKCGISCNQITIVDDDSDDLETIQTLERFAQKIEVTSPSATSAHETLGGLYANMQWAMNDAKKKQYEYCFFVQDDMQFTRPFLTEDIVNIETYFTENPECIQLQPCFLKKHQKYIDSKFADLDKSKIAYLRTIDFPGYSSFSAVGVFHVDKFFKFLQAFEPTEYSNNLKARKQGIKLGYYVYPFLMYLPFPISHREGRRSLLLKVIEFIGTAGFYPVTIMTAEECNVFLRRNIDEKAYAEDWLHHPQLSHIKTWTYGGGISKLCDRGGWRSLLGKFLRALNNTRLLLKSKYDKVIER
jgi:glycosyltransferase involved in cell wall biosynthesis